MVDRLEKELKEIKNKIAIINESATAFKEKAEELNQKIWEKKANELIGKCFISCRLWITFLSYFLLGLSLAIIHCEYNTLQWFDILAIIIIVFSMFSFASWEGFRIMELN